jgi:hypothetical protein
MRYACYLLPLALSSACGSGVGTTTPSVDYAAARVTCAERNWFTSSDFDSYAHWEKGNTYSYEIAVSQSVCIDVCGNDSQCSSDCSACNFAIIAAIWGRE